MRFIGVLLFYKRPVFHKQVDQQADDNQTAADQAYDDDGNGFHVRSVPIDEPAQTPSKQRIEDKRCQSDNAALNCRIR